MTKYRHKKRGTIYDYVGIATLQTDKPLSDYAVVIVYKDEEGMLWAREKNEFLDGRFEIVNKDNI